MENIDNSSVHTNSERTGIEATIAAMQEAERIANDPNAKVYSDVEEALRELKR